MIALHTNTELQATVDGLRKQYYPQRLNKVPAHVCLFHALPGSQLAKVQADLQELVRNTSPFLIEIRKTPRQFANGHGIALEVDAPEATQICKTLSGKWRDFLSKQDLRFGAGAHYTIAN